MGLKRFAVRTRQVTIAYQDFCIKHILAQWALKNGDSGVTIGCNSSKHKARVFASALGITAENVVNLQTLIRIAAVEGEQQFENKQSKFTDSFSIEIPRVDRSEETMFYYQCTGSFTLVFSQRYKVKADIDLKSRSIGDNCHQLIAPENQSIF